MLDPITVGTLLFAAYGTYRFANSVVQLPSTVIHGAETDMKDALLIGRVTEVAKDLEVMGEAQNRLIESCAQELSLNGLAKSGESTAVSLINSSPDLEQFRQICQETLFPQMSGIAVHVESGLREAITDQAQGIVDKIPVAIEIVTKGQTIKTFAEQCQEMFQNCRTEIDEQICQKLFQQCHPLIQSIQDKISTTDTVQAAGSTMVKMCQQGGLLDDHTCTKDVGTVAANSVAANEANKYFDQLLAAKIVAIAFLVFSVIALGSIYYLRHRKVNVVEPSLPKIAELEPATQPKEVPKIPTTESDHDDLPDVFHECLKEEDLTPPSPPATLLPKPATLVAPSLVPSIASNPSETIPPTTTKVAPPKTPKKYNSAKNSLESLLNTKPSVKASAPKSSSSSNGWGSRIRRWFSSLRSCVRSFFSIFRF